MAKMAEQRIKISIKAIMRRKIKSLARDLLQRLPAGLKKEHYQNALATYDNRSGSYVIEYRNRHNPNGLITLGCHQGEVKEVKYGDTVDLHNKWLAALIDDLLGPTPGSILEAGAGECTTIVPIAHSLKRGDVSLNAIDISWSRCKVAKEFAAAEDIELSTLSSANILQLPYADNSIDVVYSNYCLEELGGFETDALREMFRVAKKYVFVVEASYELGSKAQRHKLYNRGWNLGIIPAVKKLGYKVLRHEMVPYCHDHYHHGALILIEKDANSSNMGDVPSFACPKCHGKLEKIEENFKCQPCGLVYPSLKGIPVFLVNNAILASHYES
ncbi:methyltransferase domain-containing protein [Thalassospira tepidiphila]|uniref:methyltransferase domain-containing protein n=1 Tax=Thalassospira tepidiphila TaxID=393657 RepID=UPI0030C6E02E